MTLFHKTRCCLNVLPNLHQLDLRPLAFHDLHVFYLYANVQVRESPDAERQGFDQCQLAPHAVSSDNRICLIPAFQAGALQMRAPEDRPTLRPASTLTAAASLKCNSPSVCLWVDLCAFSPLTCLLARRAPWLLASPAALLFVYHLNSLQQPFLFSSVKNVALPCITAKSTTERDFISSRLVAFV